MLSVKVKETLTVYEKVLEVIMLLITLFFERPFKFNEKLANQFQDALIVGLLIGSMGQRKQIIAGLKVNVSFILIFFKNYRIFMKRMVNILLS